jgi:hypothetical protein
MRGSFPGVYFINILHAHFVPIFLHQKLQSCVLGLKFFGAKMSAKKPIKLLMKLTPGAIKFGWMGY